MWHEIYHVLGLDDPSGPWYLFWSGAGGDIAKITIPAALLLELLRRVSNHHRMMAANHKEHMATIDRLFRKERNE